MAILASEDTFNFTYIHLHTYTLCLVSDKRNALLQQT